MKRSRSEVAPGSEAYAKTQRRGKDSSELFLQGDDASVESSSSSSSSPTAVLAEEDAGATTGVWDLTSELGGGGHECLLSWWGVEEEKLLGWFPFADEHFVPWWREEEEESRGGDDIWQLQRIHEIPATAKQ